MKLKDLPFITSLPLSDLWKMMFWTAVDMDHLSHNAVGFQLSPYCDKTLGKKNWDRIGTVYYFRKKNDAVMFKLKWS